MLGRGIFSCRDETGIFSPAAAEAALLQLQRPSGTSGGRISDVPQLRCPARPVGLLCHLAATACLVRLSWEGNRTRRSSFLFCFLYVQWGAPGSGGDAAPARGP